MSDTAAAQIVQTQVSQPEEADNAHATPGGGDHIRADGKREYEPGKDESKVDFSSRFAALSKREKELLAKSKAIKEKEQYIQEYQDAQKLAKENPLKFMEKFGVTYDQLTNFVLDAKDSEAEENTVEGKISRLEKSLEEERQEREREKKEREEREKREQEEADEKIISAYKNKIQEHVESNPDDCEMIRLTDNYDLVFEVAQEHYEQTGQILPPQDAAKAVEDYLTKEAQEKILKAKKFAKVTDEKPEENSGSELPERWVAKESPTLTNDLATDGGNPVDSNVPSWVDDEESKRRAAAWLESQMRK